LHANHSCFKRQTIYKGFAGFKEKDFVNNKAVLASEIAVLPEKAQVIFSPPRKRGEEKISLKDQGGDRSINLRRQKERNSK